MTAHPQLPLSLGLKDSTLFANFIAGENAEASEYLRRLPAEVPGVYLWGESGCGKSHLLQAVCHAAGERSAAAFYLPLRAADEFPYDALHGLEEMAVVCVDDVDAIAGDERWEQALLALYDRVKHAGNVIVVTGRRAPAELRVDPSLASRLAWGLMFQLKPLSDRDKRDALRLRADRRGLRLGDDAARLLVRHYGSSMTELFERFEQLDKASLAAKKKITAGFIRRVLTLDDG